jgi:hypothetical protein
MMYFVLLGPSAIAFTVFICLEFFATNDAKRRFYGK